MNSIRRPLYSRLIPKPLLFDQKSRLLEGLFINQLPITDVLVPSHQAPDSSSLILTGLLGTESLIFTLRPIDNYPLLQRLYQLHATLLMHDSPVARPIAPPMTHRDYVVLAWSYIPHRFFTGCQHDRIALLTAMRDFHHSLYRLPLSSNSESILSRWISTPDSFTFDKNAALDYVQNRLHFDQFAHNDLHIGNFLLKPCGSGVFIDLEEAIGVRSHPFVDIHAVWERFYRPLNLNWNQFCSDLEIVGINGYVGDSFLYQAVGELKNRFSLAIANNLGLASEASKFRALLGYWDAFY